MDARVMLGLEGNSMFGISNRKSCKYKEDCFFQGECNNSDSCSHYFVVQSIVNRDGVVFAYELLTRPTRLNGLTVEEYFLRLNFTEGSKILEKQITNLINKSLTSCMFVDTIFVNVERYILTNNYMVEKLLLCRNKLLSLGVEVVFEITERFEYSDKLIRKTFTRLLLEDIIFAADDYCFSKVTHQYIKDYTYVKVDMTEILLGLDRNYNKFLDGLYSLKQDGAKLIAEKIETENEYLLVRLLPFDFFQGYYFDK
ncbi:EAL domain-containing protein [Shewanella sp. D64]|uniref:EAL domain-containing protein n=1 Tax=unclassified Shewanella TaxID=196818 RepID=UPI0022BA3588|nr:MULTISPECIES: EAL domain-containing protein [unclassified Shewanella]MEC4726296.1 EAL domain-containing protein [Shewanella sp. D64]MEC4738308.1 EAL domain-containing protein [Shewanella sp. E94]WBJ95443.1 EAL domain-containing protein [Shewanella sp. MTB7]